jgi:hypothetical protein
LEVKARLDGSIENLTDEQLFSAFHGLVAPGAGAEAFAASLHADGAEGLDPKGILNPGRIFASV